METTTTAAVTPSSVGLRYGLFLGLSWLLIDFVLRQLNLTFISYGIVTFAASLIATVLLVVFAHRDFKKGNDGLMTYKQGLVITLFIGLIWGFFSALFNYLYVHYIDPEFVDRMREGMVDFMERNRVPQTQIEKSTVQFDEMKSSFGKALFSGLKSGLVSGVIFGLIVPIFTKRSLPEFE